MHNDVCSHAVQPPARTAVQLNHLTESITNFIIDVNYKIDETFNIRGESIGQRTQCSGQRWQRGFLANPLACHSLYWTRQETESKVNDCGCNEQTTRTLKQSAAAWRAHKAAQGSCFGLIVSIRRLFKPLIDRVYRSFSKKARFILSPEKSERHVMSFRESYSFSMSLFMFLCVILFSKNLCGSL